MVLDNCDYPIESGYLLLKVMDTREGDAPLEGWLHIFLLKVCSHRSWIIVSFKQSQQKAKQDAQQIVKSSLKKKKNKKRKQRTDEELDSSIIETLIEEYVFEKYFWSTMNFF